MERRARSGTGPGVRIGVVVLSTLVVGVLGSGLEEHVPEAAGTDYWRWFYRVLPWTRIAWAMGPALVLGWTAWRVHQRSRDRHETGAWFLAAAFLWAELVLAGANETGFSLRNIERIVASPVATSYWNAALDLVGDRDGGWLAEWHVHMPGWPLHARNKPPGPVLFYVLMHVVAEDRGTFLGALVIMSLAATVVPATYAFARSLGASAESAFFAACTAALAPGPLVIAPELDQVYPLLTIGTLAAWCEALRRRSLLAAALTGVVMFVATCFAFHLAAIGLPLAFVALAYAWRERSITPALTLASAALASFTTLHAVLAIRWGYDVFAVLQQALDDRRTMSAYHDRVGPESRIFDLVDFGLGIGWPALIAGLASLLDAKAPLALRRTTLAGVVLLATLALLRLLPTETARTWMFVQPLMHVGAGACLARVGPAERAWTLALALAMAALTARNLAFVAP